MIQLQRKPIQICYLGPSSYFNLVRLCFSGVHTGHVVYNEMQVQQWSRKKILDFEGFETFELGRTLKEDDA